MKLEEAHKKLKSISNIKFKNIFNKKDLQGILKNKGKTGHLLELSLGINLSNRTLDFENGELKTNKCSANGKPLETIWITQISNAIDAFLTKMKFQDTHLYKKIKNILYVPVCKIGTPENWMFLDSIHIDLQSPKFEQIAKTLELDYYAICEQLVQHIETSEDGFIHTSNGKYLQVRSKDSKDKYGNYNPIYSEIYNRYVSNKNHGFYFKKNFIKDIKKL